MLFAYIDHANIAIGIITSTYARNNLIRVGGSIAKWRACLLLGHAAAGVPKFFSVKMTKFPMLID